MNKLDSDIKFCGPCERFVVAIDGRGFKKLDWFLMIITFGLWWFMWTLKFPNHNKYKCIHCGTITK